MTYEQTFCIKLVQVVEKYPCVYNSFLTEYARKDIVEETWTKIGAELGESVGKCKERWRNIRTVFARHLKGIASGEKRKRLYYLHDRLQFLVPFLKFAPTDQHSQPTQSHSIEDSDADESMYRIEHIKCEYPDQLETSQDKRPSSFSFENYVHEPEEHEQEGGECSFSVSNQSDAKRKREDEDVRIVQSCSCRPDDPTKAFLLSLLPDLQGLNDREMRQFKRRVIEVIDDIIDSRPPLEK